MSKFGNEKLSRGRGQRGIALLEALLALGIAVAGLLALIGFNARVAGMNMQNRINSAAMLAAQAKLEELRNTDFDSLVAGSDNVSFASPGFATQLPVSIDRCWTLAAVSVPNVSTTNLYTVTVAAVRQGGGCSTDIGARPAARLVTLIARTNPRVAAKNVATSAAADGAGKLIKGVPSGTPVSTTPGGFQIYQDSGGNLTGVYNPQTNTTLAPGTGSLLFAVINGNIMFDRALTAEEFKRLQVQAEGNGLCRKFYPGYSDTATSNPTPPTIAGGGQTLAYVQYSCVVADGWRRSVLVFPPGVSSTTDPLQITGEDKVCVGYPAMQPSPPSGGDLLQAGGRQYVGRKETTLSGLAYELSGMRGTADGVDAQIGSICAPNASAAAGDCGFDTTSLGARGWVPGGHHYFVMAAASNPYCSSRITEVLSAIDASGAGRGTTAPSNYMGYLVRNPHKVYCANTKTYTNSLPPIPFGQEFSSDECYSYTKLSGFMTPTVTASVDPSQIVFGSSSTYAVPCTPMGAFWEKGGGYACGFPESTAEIRVTPLVDGYVFSPTRYGGLDPLSFKHDIVGKSFTYGLAGPTCPATTLTWGTSPNVCSAAVLSVSGGASTTVNNTTSGYTGAATFACTGSTWGSATSASCTPLPTGSCSATSTSWTVSGVTCTGTLAAANNGVATPVTASGSGQTGSANFTCSNGSYGSAPDASPAPTCTAVTLLPCNAGTVSWTANGNSCSGPIAATSSGNTSSATANNGFSGSASFACNNGSYGSALTGATCNAVCSTLRVAGTRKKDVPVTLDGVACSYPTDVSYACTKSNVSQGTTVMVNQAGNGANNKTTNVTVVKDAGVIDCDYAVNF